MGKKVVSYDGIVVGRNALAVRDMLEMAKENNAFCYTEVLGKPFVIEPEMTFDEAIKALQASKTGEIKTAIYDTVNDFYMDDVARGMEKMAKDNDFVISTVYDMTFGIKKGMTAKDALDTIENIRQDRFLEYQKNRGKNYTPELNAFIKDEVYEPHDKNLWQSLNSNRIMARSMEEVEVYGRVMSHLMKEQKADKPNAEMLEQTLNIVRQHTKWTVNESSDNLIVEYLLATWKHGEELANDMGKNGNVDYYRKKLGKYGENPTPSIPSGRDGLGE